MRPTTAADEAAALAEIDRAALAGEPFRLVILDAGMPGSDGWPFDRPDPRGRSRTPAARSSSWFLPARRELPAHYRQLPRTQFLTKPAKYSELIDAVDIGSRRQSRKNRPPATRWTANVRQLQILLAEDGLVNQEVAVGLLEMRGHHVEVANNGREALAALERQPFDLVLMDLEMPEMDGLEAAAAIRAKEANRRRPRPHHRHDRSRREGISRTLPGGRHGRLYHQADQARGVVPSRGGRQFQRCVTVAAAAHGRTSSRRSWTSSPGLMITSNRSSGTSLTIHFVKSTCQVHTGRP